MRLPHPIQQYRMPAEWAPHYATLLSWPRNAQTWPGEKLDRVERVFAQIVQALLPYEAVLICAGGIEHRVSRVLTRAGIEPGELTLLPFETNDNWMRDHGPILVQHRDTQELAVTNWGYNAWGGKYPPYDLDNQIPEHIARFLELPVVSPPLILEGGSIEVDGQGTLLTTESCLLNPNRNPHLGQAEIEEALRTHLGIERILWLADGVAGDDTDGHIDDLTRLVGTDTILTIVEPAAEDENYAILQENLRRIRGFRTATGQPYRVLQLPMPPPLVADGVRLPASYANYYVANGVVLLPTFGVPTDQAAMEILQQCYPERRIIPIRCEDLLWGLGGIHCVTQQVPTGVNLT
jgi:agmatine deiminase